MNILIIGSGAREHALAEAFARSKRSPTLFCCGTHRNPGIEKLTQAYWVGDILSVTDVVSCAKQWQIKLAIIGPEAPLEKGLADALWAQSIPTIGPRRLSAQIETSKQFARDLMKRHHIPGVPRYRVFSTMEGIEAFLNSCEHHYVIKADKLMGGKGVKVSGEHLHTIEEALVFCATLLKQQSCVLIEQKLIGQEFSCMGFCDGEHMVPMPIVQDHKRAFEGDVGPNTGGMGSYSDSNHRLPFLTDREVTAAQAINQAVLRALYHDTQEKYIGILYGSFIATQQGVFVIEFNARFGDPEALNVLTVLSSDWVTVCEKMCIGQLSTEVVQFQPKATVCKYVVPIGYPDQKVMDAMVSMSVAPKPVSVYLGSIRCQDGVWYTAGSRTAAYVGVADTLAEAEQLAEQGAMSMTGPLFHRTDIGTARSIQKRIDQMRTLRQ